MTDAKRRRLDTAIAAIYERHGPQMLRLGKEFTTYAAFPHIATGFLALDAITGCQGLPVGAITLLTGHTTSGKLTVAYKFLAKAQRNSHGAVAHTVALFDLNCTADPDYLTRCGIDLGALLVARPALDPKAVDLIGDLLQTRRLRAILVDSLADLTADPAARQRLHSTLGRLQQLLRAADCALVLLDEASPPWRRWLNLDSSSLVRRCAALHIEMQRECWLERDNTLTGYRAQARLLKSRWVYGIRSAPVEIVFNGTVEARETW